MFGLKIFVRVQTFRPSPNFSADATRAPVQLLPPCAKGEILTAPCFKIFVPICSLHCYSKSICITTSEYLEYFQIFAALSRTLTWGSGLGSLRLLILQSRILPADGHWGPAITHCYEFHNIGNNTI